MSGDIVLVVGALVALVVIIKIVVTLLKGTSPKSVEEARQHQYTRLTAERPIPIPPEKSSWPKIIMTLIAIGLAVAGAILAIGG